MNRIHYVESVYFSGNNMCLTIDGKDYTFNLKSHSKKLLNASQVQRENFEISPAGYGIHWPLIDEDISIDTLLGIKHNSPPIKKVG